MYQFRDPIHGFIEVSELEKKIIDSPSFQRLRNIRQLATTYLVYHGAEHTRFGHSLGVMHLVTKTYDSIVKKKESEEILLFRDKEEENGIVTLWYRQILRLIALTHDLGHAPFSHASENLFEKGYKHEHYTKMIITQTEIADYINEIGKSFQLRYGESYNITPELVWMIYDGKDVMNTDYIMPDFKFLQSFMDGELDCDKMDYLLRDSHYCGVSYGKYDLNRFISTLTVYKNKRDNIMQIAIEKGGIQALEEFILARYFMFIQVYFHKIRRYFDSVLVQCLENILKNKKYPTNIKEYLFWDDARVLSLINDKDCEVKEWYSNRLTWTCVYETTAHANGAEEDNFNIIYRALRKAVGKSNILQDKVDKVAHKFFPRYIPLKDDSGQGLRIIDKDSSRSKDIMEVSLILRGIMQSINIQRIYINKKNEQKAREIIDQYIRPVDEEDEDDE